jgi:hypothetical protein
MTKYNAEFVANPEAFMKRYSCAPVGNISGRTGVADATEFVPDHDKKDYKYRVMPGKESIAWLNFDKVHRPDDFASRAKAVMAHHATSQILVTGSYTPDPLKVRAYFLPWDPDNIISLTIPPVAAGRHGVSLFFTAGINGCSIFIKGSAQNPTIYHAGGFTNREHDAAKGAAFWEELMESHDATKIATTGPTLATVNKTDYTVDMVLSKVEVTGNKGGQITQVKNTKLGTMNSRIYEQWLNQDQGDEFMIESVAPTGCVMGMRDAAGDWSFYLQQNVTIEYYKFKKKWTITGTKRKKIEASKNTVMRPLVFSKFFPTGTGHVKFDPSSVRKLKG